MQWLGALQPSAAAAAAAGGGGGAQSRQLLLGWQQDTHHVTCAQVPAATDSSITALGVMQCKTTVCTW
jgi:hypothetical protein